MSNMNLSAAQAEQRNTQDYIDRFIALSNASVGVILTPTREPFRAISALRECAAATKTPFRVWTMTQGWATFDLSNPESAPITDGVLEPVPALQKINDSDFEDNGIFVMMYSHKAIGTIFKMVQLLKEYAHNLIETHKRLVIIVPQSYQLPEELEDDIVRLEFDVPSYAELRDNYTMIMEQLDRSAFPNFDENGINRIIAAGSGMTSDEFDNALSRAIIECRPRLPNIEVDDIASVIMKVKTEMVKRSEVLEVMEPGTLDEIGGLDNLKEWIGKRAKCFGQEARDFGIEPPKGVALIGPPGTGKSLAAKAVAAALGIPGLRFDVGRVFNSLVGKSEERVRNALKMVDAMAPCVLMIDEADKAFAGQAGGGSSGDSGVGMRVLGAILTWMQETKSPVFVVVTANRVQNLPTEFLRRGRLDEIFSVTIPNEQEIKEILEIHLRKRNKDPKKVASLDAAARKCVGYVAAEIEAAVKDAIIESFVDSKRLDGALIGEQLDNMVPISVAFEDDFERMAKWAHDNARPASLDLSGSKAPASKRAGRKSATSALGPRRGRELGGAVGTGLDG